MPRSILLGRPLPSAGEPLFTEEDTAYALALAEEERDACPKCGMPKDWCRDIANQFAFEVAQEQCHASAALATFQASGDWTGKQQTTRYATQLWARFRPGYDVQFDAGLDLGDVEAGEGPVVDLASEVAGPGASDLRTKPVL